MSAGSHTRVRCKPGDRCRIIAPSLMSQRSGKKSPNLGHIVVIVRPYQPGETVSGAKDWFPDAPGGGLEWVVMSLADGIACQTMVEGRIVEERRVMVMPIADCRLEPLDDDEGGVEESTLRRQPRPAATEGGQA